MTELDFLIFMAFKDYLVLSKSNLSKISIGLMQSGQGELSQLCPLLLL